MTGNLYRNKAHGKTYKALGCRVAGFILLLCCQLQEVSKLLLILKLAHVRISLLHPLTLLHVGSKCNQLEVKEIIGKCSALHLYLNYSTLA